MSVKGSHWIVLAGLASLMAATRIPAMGAMLHLQDASWAVFFIAGFYLKGQWRWAFPLLMAEAVGIDYCVIQYTGISNYCVTVAYWFLVPAYATLWLGASWLRRHDNQDLRGLVSLFASLVIALSVCFLISNGSFYWLGGRVAERTWHGWIANFSAWYWPFLRVPAVYVGVAALIHVIVRQARLLLDSRSGRAI